MTATRIDIEGVPVSPDHQFGGRRVASARTFEDRSPLDWSLKLGDFARGDAASAEQAVTAAVEAFPDWSAAGISERSACMHRLADLIEANVTSIARLECLDMAMLQESLELRVIPRGARILAPTRTWPASTRGGPGAPTAPPTPSSGCRPGPR